MSNTVDSPENSRPHEEERKSLNNSPISDSHGALFSDDGLAAFSNGLEFQVAIDSLATGNTDPLKNHMARLAGLDPSEVQMSSSPFEPKESELRDWKFKLLGKMDNLTDPNDKGFPQPRSRKRATPVILAEPDKLYTYSPLDHGRKQIRLLRLSPANQHGIIDGFNLQIFDLSEAPRFLALSYVWGRPEKNMSLPCGEGYIAITQNLSKAIETSSVRYPDSWIWADGVCINQDDLIERGHQVAMMGDIYTQASMVIAHTGHHRYAMVPESPQDSKVMPTTIGDPNDTLGVQELNVKVDSPEPTDIGSKPPNNERVTNVRQSNTKKPEFFTVEAVTAPSSSQPAVSLMNYLARIWYFEEDFALKSGEDWKKSRIPDVTRDDIELWVRLFQFWSEDWFHRSWVLQEAVLGKKVILLIDDAVCSLDFVMDFWDLARRRDRPEVLKHGPLADEYTRILHLSPVGGMKALRDVMHVKHTVPIGVEDEATPRGTINEGNEATQPEEKSDILDLLILSRVNLATDPRDKIYSLLGLARKDDVTKSIVPDYSELNRPAVLYRDVAVKLIREGHGKNLLKHAGIDQKLPGLPSWTPDWTYQSRSTMHSELYSCSGSSIPSISVSDSDVQKIVVRGVVFDKIVKAATAWRYHSLNPEQETFAPLKGSERKCPPFSDEAAIYLIKVVAKAVSQSFCTKFDTDEGVEVTMARTLAMDCSWRLQRTRTDASFLESFIAFERLYGKVRDENTPLEHVHGSREFQWVWDFEEDERDRLQTQSWPFEVAVQEAHRGRRFCTTKEGYMCTAPYDAEDDDVVVLFEGFETPYVMRKFGENWKLVGDCYVHGIMDGELIDYDIGTGRSTDTTSVDRDGRIYGVRLSQTYGTFQDFNIL